MSGSANCAPAARRPLIVTAELGPSDFAWFDQLRRAHYPPERNHVSAHLTIFHALPPSAERETRSALVSHSREPSPRASMEGVMDLGGGTALRIVSADLDRIREELSERLHGLLGLQDAGGWRPHVTIQNKVSRREARALQERLRTGFHSRSIAIRGLGLHRYLGGAWEPIAVYPFRA